jgi:hypothetical protein
MVCDGPSKTAEDNRCNGYKRAVSSSDIDTIRTIGILHFTIVVHDHIADAKFIQKCSLNHSEWQTARGPERARRASFRLAGWR